MASRDERRHPISGQPGRALWRVKQHCGCAVSDADASSPPACRARRSTSPLVTASSARAGVPPGEARAEATAQDVGEANRCRLPLALRPDRRAEALLHHPHQRGLAGASGSLDPDGPPRQRRAVPDEGGNGVGVRLALQLVKGPEVSRDLRFGWILTVDEQAAPQLCAAPRWPLLRPTFRTRGSRKRTPSAAARTAA
jgi:hypothetical protein